MISIGEGKGRGDSLPVQEAKNEDMSPKFKTGSVSYTGQLTSTKRKMATATYVKTKILYSCVQLLLYAPKYSEIN